jgi:hypothetical protein
MATLRTGIIRDQKAQAKRRDDSEPGVWTLQRLLGRATTRWRSAAAHREIILRLAD